MYQLPAKPAERVRSENKEVATSCPAFRVPKTYPNHPGGQSNLAVARESRRPDLLFLSYHMGFDLHGKVAGAAKARGISIPPTGPFFEALHAAAVRVQKEHWIQHYISMAYNFLLTVGVVITMGSFPMATPTLLRTVITAVLISSYAFNVFHMRNHKGGHLYGNSILDTITTPLYTFIEHVFMISIPHWIDHHNGSHHLFTNREHDYDVTSPFPIFRLHSKQPAKWFHAYQAYYAPLVLSANTFSYPFMNYFVYGEPLYYFLIWATYVFVLPVYFNGVGMLAWVAMFYACTGVILSYCFQVSHNHTSLGDRSEPLASVDDWCKLQISESVSWGGYFFCILLGGINFQIEHHLSPALDAPMYYYFSKEVRKICEEFKVTYVYEPTLGHAVWEYQKFLTSLSH